LTISRACARDTAKQFIELELIATVSRFWVF